MQLKNINILRGIAAFAVMWFHLTNNSGLSKGIASTGRYGYLGVEIFFVISGYILPYSMAKRNYRLTDLGKFNTKRLVRIYPPYIVALILGVGLLMFAHIQLPANHIILSQLLYLNGILGYVWTAPVFWTLAIEVQFYIFISLVYPLISSRSYTLFILGLLPFLGLAFIIPAVFLPRWLGMFGLGMILFRKTERSMPAGLLWIFTIAIGAFILYVNGLYPAIMCILTMLFIGFVPVKQESLITRTGLWLGSVSYSLYLIHWDWGRAMVAIFRHVPFLGSFEWLRLLFGAGMSLLLAWLFYKIIEYPSIRISHRMKYDHKLFSAAKIDG